MATQNEVKSYITNNMNAQQIDDDLYQMSYDFDNKRSQVVFVSVREAMMAVSSPFATTDDVTPKQAIKALESSFFGIGKIGDWYVVRHVFFLADLEEREILIGLGFIATLADEIEEELLGRDAF